MRVAAHWEVVERDESTNDGSQGRRDLWIVGICVVGLAVERILMDLSVECVPQLRHAAGDFNSLPARIDFRNIKAMIRQPCGDGGDVLVRRTELRAKLVWREPLVVAGRSRRMHLVDELLERGFLGVTAFEHQVHTVKLQTVGRGSAIVARWRAGSLCREA